MSRSGSRTRLLSGGRTLLSWIWPSLGLLHRRTRAQEAEGQEWEVEAFMGIKGGGDRKSSKVANTIWGILPRRIEHLIGFLCAFIIFAAGLTVALCHILNPDKEPLPWKTYCANGVPSVYSLQFTPASPDPHLLPLSPSHAQWPSGFTQTPIRQDVDSLPPVGIFLAVFSTPEAVERRHMIRQSYMSHWRSRTPGTGSVRVRFILGAPSVSWEGPVQSEMNAFADIVILPIAENMNSGKTHAFFQWAAENATVPNTQDGIGKTGGEARPDYVVKADDDSFIMLGELERRLRVIPRQMAFWGYLVKESFMAGEAYALSLDLVQYIAAAPSGKLHTKGKEDKLTAEWLKMHPSAENIMWISERCWIYDHPKAGSVYSHGFLFPSYVASLRSSLSWNTPDGSASTSTVSRFVATFGRYFSLYRLPAKNLSVGQKIEALVEGSEMSRLRQVLSATIHSEEDGRGSWSREELKTRIQEVYDRRPSRTDRFLGDVEERGGTVVVHFIKRQEWWVDTMLALLGGPEEVRPGW